jgi:hypothetical protein
MDGVGHRGEDLVVVRIRQVDGSGLARFRFEHRVAVTDDNCPRVRAPQATYDCQVDPIVFMQSKCGDQHLRPAFEEQAAPLVKRRSSKHFIALRR